MHKSVQPQSFFDQKRSSLYSSKAISRPVLNHQLSNKQNMSSEGNINLQKEIKSKRQLAHQSKNDAIENEEIDSKKVNVLHVRKQNAKKLREIERERENQISQLKKEFQKEKQILIEKYEAMLSEKDEHIKLLEETISMTTQNNEQPTSSKNLSPYLHLRHQKETQQIVKQNSGKNTPITNFTLSAEPVASLRNFRSQTLFLHQHKVIDDICFSIERVSSLEQSFNKNKTVKCLNFIESGQRESRKSLDMGKRATSGSKHKLNPAARPNYKATN